LIVMEIVVIVVLAVAVLVLGVIVLRGAGRGGSTPSAAGPSGEEIAAQVRLANQQALTEAMDALARRADADRAETMRIVTDMVTAQSGEALGARADVLTTALAGVQADITTRLGELNAELASLRSASSGQFATVSNAVEQLARRTQNLNEVLSSSAKRGQWGERLAEDMLRAAGFIENVNYSKQETNAAGGRPDFTFFMPPDRVLYMDVKFPLDMYVAHLDAADDATRASTRNAFVAAVKTHVNALAKREYIDNSHGEALDYVLMFVPNESISGFVHESDPTLIDYALERKVVLCSPLTLYAFLVVIRQATDSFHTEQTAASIMQQINKFAKEFENYTAAVDKVRDSMRKVGEQFDAIATDGTRYRKLRVPIKEIERQRTRQGIPELDPAADAEADDVDPDDLDP
jgi:DNA recombination protein RmuC